MSSISDEILSYYGCGSDELAHYGMPRRSGRYPWGSGDEPFQNSGDFLSRVDYLKKSGMSETDIAQALGMSTTELRAYKSVANTERRSVAVETAQDLRDKGYSLNEIAEKMGYKNDSSVRSLLDEKSKARMNQAQNTAEFLKQQIAEKGMVDVGEGVERELNISKEKLNQALAILQAEGYPVYGVGVPQATNPGKQTNVPVLCAPNTEHKDVYAAMKEGKIASVEDYISKDDGVTFEPAFHYPSSLDPKRLKVRYADEAGPDGVTGIEKDGVIELRRGVDDISLGNDNYAQVRILVGGTHYLKGMAVYSDDMPDGVDVIFNTNKTPDIPNMGPKNNTILKPIKKDPDDPNNPFGSAIKEHGGQSWYDDPNGDHIDAVTGKSQSLSLINKRAEEGDWSDWADKVPSQFLSKQPKSLAKRQIDIALEDRQAEFDEIMSLTNPTVKKQLLQSFADDCDSTAVHLHAAALPRQKYHVILPINAMGDDEVYAPNYKDGEKVALIRYPHGGTFEIPILTVNNKNAVARGVLGANPTDAVGINKKNADRLSGADFDGDTVMVIPTGSNGVNIKSTPPLKGLENFDPKVEYPYREGIKLLGAKQKQNEMGRISNLITDMTLLGASQDELAKAVRHSMVVIDAEKHRLDYKRSEVENDIAALKKRYQGHYDEEGHYHEGSSTLISRAKGKYDVDKRQGSAMIDKETGKVSYKTAEDLYYQERYDKDTKSHKKGELKYNKDGTPKMKKRTQESTRMAETDDAFTLVSDAKTQMEVLYANYANSLKAMANEARRIMVNTPGIQYSKSANNTYKAEVDSLMAKLNISLKNAPRERQAQLIAKSAIEAAMQSNPDMTREEKKKKSQRALVNARIRVGSKRNKIDITDREWEAIQSGAISENKLTQILRYADADQVRKRATPRANNALSTAQVNRIKSMKANGRTTADIAQALGISSTTVTNYLTGKE